MKQIKQNFLFLVVLLFIAVDVFFALNGVFNASESFNALILILTAGIIAVQSIATKEMVDNQMRPIVDISIRFDKEFSCSYFHFLNPSQIPVSVLMNISLTLDGIEIKGEEKKKLLDEDPHLFGEKSIPLGLGISKEIETGSPFLKKITSGKYKDVQIILNVKTAPQFKEKFLLCWREKPYKFDFQKKEWIFIDFWGIPNV